MTSDVSSCSLPLRLGSLILLTAALLATEISARGDEIAGRGPAVSEVAPGIWRFRFGTPEKFTPTHFRSAPPAVDALESLPKASPPLDLAKAPFHVSDRGCSLQLPLENHESIYGFGLITKFFDMTRTPEGQSGRRIFLKPTDSPENDLGESHAPSPFYVSSKGYGVFVDTARFASFYTGNVAPVNAGAAADSGGGGTSTDELYRPRMRREKTMLVEVPAARGIDVYLFAGPSILDAVKRYNLFSGGGALPPLWGLGVQYRGYTKFGAQDSLQLAAQVRADHMPCDMWGVEPGWQSKTYSCSFVWSSNQFPDPDGFLAEMRKMHFRMNFWEHAFTHPTSPIFTALKPWSGNYLVWNGLVPDFATPEARAIFQKQNREVLFDRQVEAVKLDECDYQPDSAKPWSFPEVTAFPSGMDGELMHSLFGLLYQQVMLAPCRDKGMRTWGLVRNSHALAASLPFVLYSDSYDHHCYVRGLANQGFNGLLWEPELRDAHSVEDLYRRLETTLFSADTVIDSWFIKNPPWLQVDRERNNRGELMEERTAVTANVRRLLQLRMQFIPYLYAAFNEYHYTGKPPIRALVLDWPQDPKTREIDDQFMFGDSVLVAPQFTGESHRQVYLPAGEWHDFWTHEKITGGKTIDVAKAPEEIPLFVKDGTLLPLAEPLEFIQADTCFKVTVNVVGDNPAPFTLYEDDGISDDWSKGVQNKLLLDDSGGTHAATRTGQYHGPERIQITGWKQF